ncbi:phosphotransferase [Nocardioides convexus]|uniref:phosphotransferase n=1 Tax=Nocardioides convexus TaxID=2712224 RepID=UPI002418742A|nr:phosphotransferase [Nocardioides convexus]
MWRTAFGGRAVVVKRLAKPGPGDPGILSERSHVAYWRREADVLDTGLTSATPGLRAAGASVEEDEAGITIVRDWVEDASSSGLFLALSIARFAGATIGHPVFLASGLLRDRLARVARRGGWPTLARTTVADVAEHLWTRRETMLALLDGLPQVPQHGDPTAANLPGRYDDDALAIDWGTLGRGPVGGDLGYLSLSSREEFEPLLDAYLLGLPGGARRPRRGAPRRAGDGRLHRPQPCRVGAGEGRVGGGSAGREVPAPRRRAAPAGAAADLPAHRGTARAVRLFLTPGRRRRCRRRRGSPCS